MRELKSIEVDEVSGGVVPLVAAAITVGKYLSVGFGAGIAAGTLYYFYQHG